jgi:hypothetical protein
MSRASRQLYTTFAATVLVTATLATLLARPPEDLKPVRSSRLELDEPPPPLNPGTPVKR